MAIRLLGIAHALIPVTHAKLGLKRLLTERRSNNMNSKHNYSGFVDLISNVRDIETLTVDVRVTATDRNDYGFPYIAEPRSDFEYARNPFDAS